MVSVLWNHFVGIAELRKWVTTVRFLRAREKYKMRDTSMEWGKASKIPGRILIRSIHISLLFQWRSVTHLQRAKPEPTPSFLNMILHKHEPGVHGEMAYSKAGAEKIKMSREYVTVPENKEVLRKWWGYIKKNEGAFTGQVWGNLSSKVHKNNNRMNKIRIHESILTIDNKLVDIWKEREGSCIQWSSD